jgi:hypothetical protein
LGNGATTFLREQQALRACARGETRQYQDSDKNDIRILSAAIPYCDLVVTDKYMAEAATQRGLGTAFNTILPTTPDGIRKATAYLLQ